MRSRSSCANAASCLNVDAPVIPAGAPGGHPRSHAAGARPVIQFRASGAGLAEATDGRPAPTLRDSRRAPRLARRFVGSASGRRRGGGRLRRSGRGPPGCGPTDNMRSRSNVSRSRRLLRRRRRGTARSASSVGDRGRVRRPGQVLGVAGRTRRASRARPQRRDAHARRSGPQRRWPPSATPRGLPEADPMPRRLPARAAGGGTRGHSPRAQRRTSAG